MSQINKCDRCGSLIKNRMQLTRGLLQKEVYQCVLMLFTKTHQDRDTEFDLCPKCLDDFYEFMRNGKSE